MVVVFDLDDTLYPEMDYVRSAYRAIARRYGAGILPAMLAASSPREAFDSTGIDIASILDIYRNHKPDIRLPWQSLYVLESLRLAGHRLGLVTDGRSTTQRNKIEALRLWRFIDPDMVMISEEVGSEKVSGVAFERIAAMCRDKDGGRYIYIGDNPAKDFYAPNRMGWMTVEVKSCGDGEKIHGNNYDSLPDDYRPKVTTSCAVELLGIVDDLNCEY